MMETYPYLLLDKTKCIQNIERMVLKAKKHNLKLRPHFKTHQSREIGEWYKEFGLNACTVSSFQMAKYFESAGWDDITIAFPVSAYDISIINGLSKSIKINIVTSSYKNINSFNEGNLKRKVGIFIELDCGHNRSGVNIENTREIALIVNLIEQNKHLEFKGFITHAGHTYSAKSTKEVETIHRKVLKNLSLVRTFWKDSYPDITISYGDTPSCSISDDFWGIDEIRPGNFVFYDLTQTSIGSCLVENIAVALICPIVDIYPERGEAIIRGGAVHLSKDSLLLPDGSKSFGAVCLFNGNTWENPIEGMYLKSISQEHGIISCKKSENFNLKVGQLVAILPIHSCLTLDSMGELFLSDGSKISSMRERNSQY